MDINVKNISVPPIRRNKRIYQGDVTTSSFTGGSLGGGTSQTSWLETYFSIDETTSLITLSTDLHVTGNISASQEVIAWIAGAVESDVLANLTASAPLRKSTDSNIVLDFNTTQFEVNVSNQLQIKAGVLTPAAHTHDASDVISGIFDVARIPDLAISKITGLQTALDSKVPTSRTVAGKALTSNITLASGDLTDSSNLAKLDASNTFTATNIFSNSGSAVRFYNPAGPINQRTFYFASGDVFSINRANDAGGFVGRGLSIVHSTGNVLINTGTDSGNKVNVDGSINSTGLYVSGTALNSSHLTDDTNLAKLDAASHAFTGTGDHIFSGNLRAGVSTSIGIVSSRNTTLSSETTTYYGRSEPLTTGTSLNSFRLDVGTGYGGKISGYLTQGAGGGLKLFTYNEGSYSEVLNLYRSTASFSGSLSATAGTFSDVVNAGGLKATGSTKVATGTGFEVYWDHVNSRSILNSYGRGTTSSYYPMQFGASYFNFYTGNVGIGVVNPTKKFHIQGTSSGQNFSVQAVTGGYADVDLISDRTTGNLGGIRYYKVGEGVSRAEINYNLSTGIDFRIGDGSTTNVSKANITSTGLNVSGIVSARSKYELRNATGDLKWSFELSGDDLVVKNATGVVRGKIDQTGNLSVEGEVTAFATL